MNLTPSWIHFTKSTTPSSMEQVSMSESIDFLCFWEHPRSLKYEEGIGITRGAICENKMAWCLDCRKSLQFYSNVYVFAKMIYHSQKKKTTYQSVLQTTQFFRASPNRATDKLQTKEDQRRQHFSSPESWYHSFHQFMKKLCFHKANATFLKNLQKYFTTIVESVGQSPPAGKKGA